MCKCALSSLTRAFSFPSRLPPSLPPSLSLLRLVKVGYADGPAARPPKEERDREVRGGVPPVHLPAAKMQLQGPPVRLILCKNKFGLGRFIQAQKVLQTIPVKFDWDFVATSLVPSYLNIKGRSS